MTPQTKTNHTSPINPDDETTIRNLYQALMDGWNQGSGSAYAAVFTNDGDLIGFDGTHLNGKEAITAFH